MLISEWFVSHHPCRHLPSKTFVGGTILQRLNREIRQNSAGITPEQLNKAVKKYPEA
jgi:hypothetical protein